MPNPAHLRSLYEAIEALPDGVVGELINGQLYTQPRLSGRHALTASNLGADLVNPFSRGRGGPGGWWIIDEPEVHLVRDAEVLVPDLAGWRRERMPHIPDDQRFTVVPDWVCEILSPSTASKDREVKLPMYARYGVRHAWLIDPMARRLEVLALENGQWVTVASFGDEGPICAPPFEVISLDAPWR
ncbi:MAG: Uma2 family endonuclease [Nitrococcus mobilis]|nr:Uma2 family endonuclease [Nitrococcus mobilis]